MRITVRIWRLARLACLSGLNPVMTAMLWEFDPLSLRQNTMMGHREKMIDGPEYDALTRWKNYLHWNPGVRKRIKRQFNKRVRKSAKAVICADVK